MPGSPVPAVKPRRECLLHPLHNRGQLKPVRQFKEKSKLVIYQTQPSHLEIEPNFRLMEHPGKQHQRVTPAEQRFSVVILASWNIYQKQ
jgi:hypothetical protein